MSMTEDQLQALVNDLVNQALRLVFIFQSKLRIKLRISWLHKCVFSRSFTTMMYDRFQYFTNGILWSDLQFRLSLEYVFGLVINSFLVHHIFHANSHSHQQSSFSLLLLPSRCGVVIMHNKYVCDCPPVWIASHFSHYN